MSELVILIGLQASGKTTFCRRFLSESHVHVSKDRFRSARNRDRRQAREIETALVASRPVVVDNTNATREVRVGLIALGRRLGARVRGYFFESVVETCRTRNETREGRGRVPLVGLYATAKIFEPPSLAEGFDDLRFVRIVGDDFEVSPWIEEEKP